MKNIKQDTFVKILTIFVGVFVVLYLVSYALFKHLLVETISQTSLDTDLIVSQYNGVWIEIFIVFIFVFIGFAYLLKKISSKLQEDIDALDTYAKAISEDKNYDAVIKVKHYLEILEISIVFKNITKRLNQKEKKSSKK